MEMNKQTSFIKVTVLQTDIVWEEAKVNRMAVEQLIEKHCDTDLFVLPEMFSTGFSMNPMEIAEDVPDCCFASVCYSRKSFG